MYPFWTISKIPVFLLFLCCHGYQDRKRFLVDNLPIEEQIKTLNGKIDELVNKVLTLHGKGEQIVPLKSFIFQQEKEIFALRQAIKNKAAIKGDGAVYVRWGRKSCPTNSTELLYTGYAGSGAYNHIGSITNYLCLPTDPTQNPRDVAVAGGLVNFLYGVEFESNFWATHAKDEDVPCAVCRSTTASTSLMIPGRDSCYPGWRKAYDGYLGSEKYTDPGNKETVCVDGNPEFLYGGIANTDGALFYPVSTKCGSLICPPYTDADPVKCVVCLN